MKDRATERPIMFKPELVRLILDDKKAMTRRCLFVRAHQNLMLQSATQRATRSSSLVARIMGYFFWIETKP